MYTENKKYSIAGNIGGEFTFADWRFLEKSANILFLQNVCQFAGLLLLTKLGPQWAVFDLLVALSLQAVMNSQINLKLWDTKTIRCPYAIKYRTQPLSSKKRWPFLRANE